TSALEAIESQRRARDEAERLAKVARFVALAEEAASRNDHVGAANALQVALQLDPENTPLRERFEAAQKKSLATLADRYIEQGQQFERQGRLPEAADAYQRALQGRPNDVALMVRAGRALLGAQRELPKAAEMARRATMLAPKSLEAAVLL